MLKYLYAQQKSKLIFFVVFSLLSSLFEIALSFVMLQSVNLAMDGNLSDALNDGLWFGLYIFCYFIVDLIADVCAGQLYRAARCIYAMN